MRFHSIVMICLCFVISVACGPKFNITPSVTFDAVNRALNITHYPPEGSECKCVFRKMEKRKRKKPCKPSHVLWLQYS